MKIARAFLMIVLLLAFISTSAFADPTSYVSKSYEGVWLWPVGNVSRHIRSHIGPRNISYGSKQHHGIDIDYVNTNTSILAARAGKAYNKGKSTTRGNYVIIDHLDGWYTLYQHLSSISFSGSIDVDAGDIIGYAGNTGTGNGGVHLHFEVSYCSKGAGYVNEYDRTWSGASRWGDANWCV